MHIYKYVVTYLYFTLDLFKVFNRNFQINRTITGLKSFLTAIFPDTVSMKPVLIEPWI